MEKLEKIYNMLYRRFRDLYYEITSIPFKIKRAISYAYISWDIHDYDYSAPLTMLNYSFSRLESLIRTGHNANGEKLAKDLRILIEYINRVKDHNDKYWYIMEDFYKQYPNRPDSLFEQEKYDEFEKRTPEYRSKLKQVLKKVKELENRDVEEISRRIKKIKSYWD